MRAVEELIDTDDPAWHLITGWIEASSRTVDVLDVGEAAARDCLRRLQVTTRSPLGALAFECGGIVVDRWLRILGGGAPGLPSLADANGIDGAAPPALVVAIDAVAGRFAINGGGLVGEIGEVCFFAPDTLQWEPLELGHGAFVEWALGEQLDDFYEDLRWDGWEQAVADLALDQAVMAYPPPFTQEGRFAELVSRRTVPWTELASLWDQMAVDLADTPDGSTFAIRPVD